MKTVIRLAVSVFDALKSVLGRGTLELLCLYLAVQIPYLGVVFYKHEFELADRIVALYFFEKVVFDFLVFFSLNLLLLWIAKSRLVALLFSIYYLSLIIVNTGVYLFSSTLLEKHHFSLITTYSIAGFVGPEVISGVALWALVCAVLWFPLRRLSPCVTGKSVLWWGILTAALAVIDIPENVAGLKRSDEIFDKRTMVFRNAQLEYSAQNPLTAFVNNVVVPSLWEDIQMLKGSRRYRRYMKKYQFIPDTYRIAHDISEVKKLADRFRVPLGKRTYPDLNLKPFTRVIVVFVESLTLDMLQCYNERLRVPTSSFLCSKSIRKQTFQNLRTTAAPTLQGLIVTLFSHPNYQIQSLTGFRNSSIELLKKAGYQTLFIRSASKFFANENITFKRWGFDNIIAREDFHEREELRKYIYGWGLEDRILYDQIVALLDERRDQKLFISVLGTDTHPLHGKKEYRYLRYPPLPYRFLITYGYARHFMKAVHHTDYDLGQFIGKLKSKGLLTDNTLVVLTADHSCQPNKVTKRIPGYPRHTFGRIPLILLTKQQLPPLRRYVLASQLDILPTLFHLLGLSVPEGWWGESLFSKDKENAFIGFHKNLVHFETEESSLLIDVMRPENRLEREFKQLFSTVLDSR